MRQYQLRVQKEYLTITCMRLSTTPGLENLFIEDLDEIITAFECQIDKQEKEVNEYAY